MEVSDLESVRCIKHKIQNHEGISPEYLELYSKDKLLDDNSLAREIDISSGSDVDVYINLRGGCDSDPCKGRFECCECLDPRGCCCICECLGCHSCSK